MIKPCSATVREAHRLMVERIIHEGSLEALLDLVSDFALSRSGRLQCRPTVSQRRYRELGPPLAAVLAIASKWGL